MSAAIVAASCCCDNQVPADNCPPDGPGADPTVRVHVTARAVACSAWTSIAPVPMNCDDPYSTFIVPAGPCNFDCSPQFPLYGPQVNWTSALGPASATYMWSTYTDEPFNPCPGKTYNFVVQSGYKSQDYEPWDADFKFALACSGDDGNDACLPCVAAGIAQFYPSEESYNNGNGIKLIARGCCCVDCACIENPKCSALTLELVARWSITLSVPSVGVGINPTFPGGGSWCNPPDYNYGRWIYRRNNETQTVVCQHEQYASVVLERTIYNTQTEAQMALGSYDIRCVRELGNQCAAVAMLGGAFYTAAQPCQINLGPEIMFVEQGLGCDEPCYLAGQTCTDAALATHGWGITVSVAAA